MSELRLATVSVVYDGVARARVCEALLAREEVVTVRVGRVGEPTVFRADVLEPTTAARIAREVGAGLGVEARGVDVVIVGASTASPPEDAVRNRS